MGHDVEGSPRDPEKFEDQGIEGQLVMRLGSSPSRRQLELPVIEFPYRRTGAVRYLPVPAALSDARSESPSGSSCFEVLARRRTRAPAGPPTDADLAVLLWAVAKVHIQRPIEHGTWQHRPTPSAGGRHPIDLILTGWPGPTDLLLYDPVAHALATLSPAYTDAMPALVTLARECSGTAAGVVIWHVAQPSRTASRYFHAESLVWRDAGALVAVTSIVCEAMGLACTPLGATGDPWLSTVLAGDGWVAGVGGCVIGSRTG
jgi:hypothetical protein